jgi:signal-transduction protein with cAMP-binding, CBS, and nucleotidyltransferase domain
MAMISNLDLIRRVPLFSMLTTDQAQSIADSVVKRRFKRGELIVEQGTKSNALGRPPGPRGHPGGAAVGRLRR